MQINNKYTFYLICDNSSSLHTQCSALSLRCCCALPPSYVKALKRYRFQFQSLFLVEFFGHLLQLLAVFGLKWVNNTRIFCIFHLKKLMEELCCAAEEFEEKKKFRSKIHTKLQRILFISNLTQKLSKYWNFNSVKDQFSK